MDEYASELPLHGALVEIANQTAERIQHISFVSERLRTYQAVVDGSAMCPTCHLLWNKPSALEALEDKDDKSRYACKQCRERCQVGR